MNVEDEQDEQAIHPADERKTLEWITTLCSARLPYRLSRDGGKWIIHVAAHDAAAAHREIDAYEAENRNWPPQELGLWRAPVTPGAKLAAGLSSAVVLFFFLWLGPYRSDIDVLRAAGMDSDAVVSGEWWRLVTALAIHADATHALGNAICLFFFTLAVCQCLGAGLGVLLILVSAAAGNAAVAFGAEMRHVGVGASTACFAAIGILSAYQFVLKLRGLAGDRVTRWRAWMPLFAGLGLLAILGTGPRSDLSAHAFGFVFGILSCLPFGWYGVCWLSRWGQVALGVTTLALFAGAWWMAAIN